MTWLSLLCLTLLTGNHLVFRVKLWPFRKLNLMYSLDELSQSRCIYWFDFSLTETSCQGSYTQSMKKKGNICFLSNKLRLLNISELASPVKHHNRAIFCILFIKLYKRKYIYFKILLKSEELFSRYNLRNFLILP